MPSLREGRVGCLSDWICSIYSSKFVASCLLYMRVLFTIISHSILLLLILSFIHLFFTMLLHFTNFLHSLRQIYLFLPSSISPSFSIKKVPPIIMPSAQKRQKQREKQRHNDCYKQIGVPLTPRENPPECVRIPYKRPFSQPVDSLTLFGI